MTLKFELDSLDGVDESIAPLYEADASGKYFLKVEGAVHKQKLEEFRNNNIKLLKERDELKVLADKAAEIEQSLAAEAASKAELEKQIKDLEAKKEEVKDDGKSKANEDELKALTKQIKQLEAARKAQEESFKVNELQLAQQLAAKEAALAEKEAKINAMLLKSEINDAATKVGVKPNSLVAIEAMARTVFKADNGQLVAYDANGVPEFSKDGSSSLSVSEWMTNLKSTIPELFLQPTGAGTQKSTTAGSDSKDLTTAERIAKGLQLMEKSKK